MKRTQKKRLQRIISICLAVSLILAPGMEAPAEDTNICSGASEQVYKTMESPVIVDIVESVDKKKTGVETVENSGYERKTMTHSRITQLPEETEAKLETRYELETATELDTPENLPDISTPAEYDLLLHLIMAEAESEPLNGKAMVARVVLNRMLSPDFPDTVSEVVYQPDQFTPVLDGRLAKAVPDESCLLALEIVLEGWDESEGALYYEAVANGTDTWHSRNLEYIQTIGNHNFYK